MEKESEKPLRIKLNKEQTLKFLSIFTDDAIRIVVERKRNQDQNKDNDGRPKQK